MTTTFDDPPASMRDAFYKIIDSPIPSHSTLLRAEDINAFYIKNATYDDFLQFESDLAQICEIILLFCESEGSFSELGSFAGNPEIASRTLVVIQDQYFNDEKSYIRLGPLQSLLNRDDSAVFTVNPGSLGINGSIHTNIDKRMLGTLLKGRISRRIDTIETHTTLDTKKEGHAIKACVGFIQEFGALLREELLLSLQHIGIDISNNCLSRYLLCAESVGWVQEKRKGDRTFCFSNPTLQKDASQFTLKEGGLFPRPPSRRRPIILEYWKTNDTERFDAITDMRGKSWAA